MRLLDRRVEGAVRMAPLGLGLDVRLDGGQRRRHARVRGGGVGSEVEGCPAEPSTGLGRSPSPLGRILDGRQRGHQMCFTSSGMS